MFSYADASSQGVAIPAVPFATKVASVVAAAALRSAGTPGRSPSIQAAITEATSAVAWSFDSSGVISPETLKPGPTVAASKHKQ